MAKSAMTSQKFADLRKRAQEARTENKKNLSALSPDEIQKLVHELDTYQIELELQNEDLRQTQEELTISRQRFSDLYDFAPVGYLTIDSTGRIIESNLTAAHLLETERKFLLNNPLSAFIADQDQDIYYHCHKNLLESKKTQVCELQLQKKDGNLLHAQCRYDISPDIDGDTGNFRIVITDISERIKAEQANIRLEAILHQTHKIEAIGTLAGGIAHNFNNILAGVIGNQELALETMPKTQKERPFIEKAFAAALRAAKLSTMMLQYLGQAQTQKQQVELVEILKEMTKILRPQIGAHIELHLEECQELTVEADPGMIRQIIANLVINAAEAIGNEKGTITLLCGQKFYSEKELRHLPLRVTVPFGEYASITVTDNGPGVDTHLLNRTFDPFFSTKFIGRGMGLSTILGIMRAHQGSVVFESVPQKGTTVQVLFPALKTKGLPSEQKTPPTTAGDNILKGTVLLVDDDPFLLELESTILQDVGLDVLSASDGLEALEIFRKQEKKIDIILLDIAMPHLNGIITLTRIREISSVPVILVTGYHIDQISPQLKGIVNIGLLQKPFAIKELKSRIEELLSRPFSEELHPSPTSSVS